MVEDRSGYVEVDVASSSKLEAEQTPVTLLSGDATGKEAWYDLKWRSYQTDPGVPTDLKQYTDAHKPRKQYYSL